jgi:hypothetical protein
MSRLARGWQLTKESWAAVQLIVGGLIAVVQAVIREEAGALVARLVGGLTSLAWSAASFFVLPVIALEGVGLHCDQSVTCHLSPVTRHPRRSVAGPQRISDFEPHRGERQDTRERVVVSVHVKNGSLVLLGAGGDQEVWDRHAMLALTCELTLSDLGGRNRFGVGPEFVELIEFGLEFLVRVC